ncbi:MAG: sarcosine oxidase subunit alpha family protein [Pseudomonadota bacterium]
MPVLRDGLWPGRPDAGPAAQSHRIGGGLVDRGRTLGFTFNGRRFEGYEGDTLASALLANGQRLVGRSFKYHRPRGILTAGSEEPNALVELGDGTHREPNTRATVTPLTDGLVAQSQNHVGPLSFDAMAVTDLAAPLIGAGFYYKTFMWPKGFWERVYEPLIRRAAGLGRLSTAPDPDSYDHGYLHCDLLVIGAGPAGLSAALAASRAGARVIIADEDRRFGGRLLAETYEVNGGSGAAWAAQTAAELAASDRVTCLQRTTVYGAFDHSVYGAVEVPARQDHRKPRQIHWRIYANRAVLAAGAIERPIAFANNDRPGIMMAGAVRAYINRYGVAPGRCASVFTTSDDGWRTARDLAASGIEVAAIIDTRPRDAVQAPPVQGVRAIYDAEVANTRGRLGLTTIRLTNGEEIYSDCLAVSGGWNPSVHLTCHKRGKPEWRDDIAAFVPSADAPQGMTVAGAANGTFSLAAALTSGHAAGAAAAQELGFGAGADAAARADDEPTGVKPHWYVGASAKQGRAWVDYQNDVTGKDIAQAHMEGFRSVEHAKRYTTLGMATDQGKTANLIGLALLSEAAGQSIAETGTTIYRPPYTPVPIGAFAGRARGKAYRPTRRTPGHDWAAAHGASFVETGAWLRAEWFAQPGETHWRQSVDREVMVVREAVGICDVSTLGKIDVQGPDAATLLDRLYANMMSTLKVGRTRYGLMLREDGIVFDDGTVARLGDDHFLITTTTAQAGRVFEHMEFCHQGLWPGLDVSFESVTDAWFQVAVAGPKSRALLERIVDAPFDLSNTAFPFMACSALNVCGGTPARLFRISFSGELAYELVVPSRYGPALMDRLMQAGCDLGVAPYGVEALNVLRIEKGHAAGGELNGQTTAAMLGLGAMVSAKKDCIGKVLSKREALVDAKGPRLMGFRPVQREAEIDAGAHFIAKDAEPSLATDEGHMTSVAYSPTLGHMIGLGLIDRGADRIGEIVVAYDAVRGRNTDVEIVSPYVYDPDGGKQRG